jgi:hypothetical protein
MINRSDSLVTEHLSQVSFVPRFLIELEIEERDWEL